MHVLVNRYVDQGWLSRRWYEITGTSYIAYMERVDDIRNPAAYMLKYMTKAHHELELYRKGERIYGFFGQRAPAKKLLGFESEPVEFILGQHWNPESKYWQDYTGKIRSPGIYFKITRIDGSVYEYKMPPGHGWQDWPETGFYNRMQQQIGPSFINYIEQRTEKYWI